MRGRIQSGESSLEEMKIKLQQEESSRRELENNFKIQENAWKIEKASMLEKLKLVSYSES